VQDPSTLLVYDPAVASRVFTGAEPLASIDRSYLFIHDPFAVFDQQVFPILAEQPEIFLRVFAVQGIENARELGKALREPLVVVTFPTDPMAPPLVRGFVGAKSKGNLRVVSNSQSVPLGGVEEGEL